MNQAQTLSPSVSSRRSIVIPYVPSKKQTLFHTSIADEILFGGAAGGGKSKASVMEACALCLEYDPSCGKPFSVYMFRRTYKELEDSLITEAVASIPDTIAKYVQGAHEMRFLNGAVIKFRHLENEADVIKYQGAEIQALFIDELTHFTKFMYDYLKTRLRAVKELNFKPRVRCTSNPGGIGHGWVKDYFVAPHPFGGTHEKEIWSEILQKYKRVKVQYIPATVVDNPHLGEDYIFQLEAKPEHMKKALLNGDWDTFAGQVFTEWVNNPKGYDDHLWTHVINPFPIPKHWRRYCSFDFGYSKPFSIGWWAVDENGRVYRYREWYGCIPNEPDTGLKMHADKIAEIMINAEVEAEPGMQYTRIADPAIFDEQRGESIARLMAKKGVHWRKADNKRLPGKMQVHNRLAFNDYGQPGMYIFKNCTSFIRTVPSLVYDPRKVEDVDTKAEDHIYDETRYFLMENPIKARTKIIQPKRPVRNMELPYMSKASEWG